MPETYDKIATYTVTGSSASSYTFTSIPSTYTDIVLIASVKNTTNNANCKFQLNSDTGTNYSSTWLEGVSVAQSGRESNATSAFLYYNGGAGGNNWTTVIANFQNYSNTTTNKTVVTKFGNTHQVGSYVNLWRNTAAISSLKLNAITDNFQVDSTFTLYGIKAA
jgi:hypothetical protein